MFDTARFRGAAALEWNIPFSRGQNPPPQLPDVMLCAVPFATLITQL